MLITRRFEALITFLTLCLFLVLSVPSQAASCGKVFAHRNKGSKDLQFSIAPKHPRLNRLLHWMAAPFGLRKLNEIYGEFQKNPNSQLTPFERLRDALGLRVKDDSLYLSSIPDTGPLLVVVNHPRLGIDTTGIVSLLAERNPGRRADIKVLTNELVGAIPEFASHVIVARPVSSRRGEVSDRNIQAIRESIDWLRKGGILVVHPAGFVSLRKSRGSQDLPWFGGLRLIVEKAKPSILPAFVSGRSGALIDVSTRINPEFNFLFAAHEIVRQVGSTVRVRFGEVVSYEDFVGEVSNQKEWMSDLRKKVYELEKYDQL